MHPKLTLLEFLKHDDFQAKNFLIMVVENEHWVLLKGTTWLSRNLTGTRAKY